MTQTINNIDKLLGNITLGIIPTEIKDLNNYRVITLNINSEISGELRLYNVPMNEISVTTDATSIFDEAHLLPQATAVLISNLASTQAFLETVRDTLSTNQYELVDNITNEIEYFSFSELSDTIGEALPQGVALGKAINPRKSMNIVNPKVARLLKGKNSAIKLIKDMNAVIKKIKSKPDIELEEVENIDVFIPAFTKLLSSVTSVNNAFPLAEVTYSNGKLTVKSVYTKAKSGSARNAASWKLSAGTGGNIDISKVLNNSRLPTVTFQESIKNNLEDLKKQKDGEAKKEDSFSSVKEIKALKSSVVREAKKEDSFSSVKEIKALKSSVREADESDISKVRESKNVGDVKKTLREFYKAKASKPVVPSDSKGIGKRLAEISDRFDNPDKATTKDVGDNTYVDSSFAHYPIAKVEGGEVKFASLTYGTKNIGKLISIGGSVPSGYDNSKPANPAYQSVTDNSSIRDSLIGSMMKAGPDFMNNMYNIFFIKDVTGENILTSSNNEEQRVLDTIGVRLDGITIPQQKNNTFSVSFLDREIKKVGSSYNENHIVDLTFDSDENCFLQRFFYSMTGQKLQKINDSESEKKAFELIPSTINKKVKTDIVVTYNEFLAIGQSVGYENMLPSYFSKFQRPTSSGEVNADYRENLSLGKDGSYKAFVFKDVRFLGFSKGLDFNRDNSDVVKFGVSFRFKRLETIDTDLS